MNITPWLLLATFIMAVLKLTGTLVVSWWVVFAPMMFLIAALLLALLIATVVAAGVGKGLNL